VRWVFLLPVRRHGHRLALAIGLMSK
jgi:hypothetical protein